MTYENGPRSLRDPLERSAIPGESSSGILADRSATNLDLEYAPAGATGPLGRLAPARSGGGVSRPARCDYCTRPFAADERAANEPFGVYVRVGWSPKHPGAGFHARVHARCAVEIAERRRRERILSYHERGAYRLGLWRARRYNPIGREYPRRAIALLTELREAAIAEHTARGDRDAETLAELIARVALCAERRAQRQTPGVAPLPCLAGTALCGESACTNLVALTKTAQPA
jgi:hypothetical protein